MVDDHAESADVLTRAAELMRRERFNLAAWEVYECAKPWREADADVAEAIDFCEFYAREMIPTLPTSPPRCAGRDESRRASAARRRGRDSPLEFSARDPLRDDGRRVGERQYGRPQAERTSPMMAWHLADLLKRAGLPEGVLTVLPGFGDIGAALVEHPEVDLVAFTGSRAVGLEINRRAAESPPGQDHVKRVIAEMGGKNAVIVDDDADLDEAVVGVLQTAFSYSGQKCSACSRVIVLESVYDAFLARLAEAVHDLPVGPADEPDTAVGPVIDARAADRIWEFARLARREGRIVAQVDVGALIDKGAYVGPLIVADVARRADRSGRSVRSDPRRAPRRRFDEALAIANGTEYALTGGLYSRSPACIAGVSRVPRRQPLHQSSDHRRPRRPPAVRRLQDVRHRHKSRRLRLSSGIHVHASITENTLHRGFAPEEPAVATGAAGGLG